MLSWPEWMHARDELRESPVHRVLYDEWLDIRNRKIAKDSSYYLSMFDVWAALYLAKE